MRNAYQRPLPHTLWQGVLAMEATYPLFFGGQAVGKVRLAREGLYYRFSCRCRLSGEVVCRVMVSWGGSRESLGVLAPMGDGFGLETKVPAKRFGEGKPEFTVMPSRPPAGEKFVPIYPEEPFSYIERLKEGFLAVRDGQVGVVLRD